MGMYDTIEIDDSYGLPKTDEWQTKCTPVQWLNVYRIDKDGRLLHQVYDTEDRSNGKSLAGAATRVNKRFVPADFRGAISFYSSIEGVWHEYSALFDEGQLISIKQLEPKQEQPNDSD